MTAIKYIWKEHKIHCCDCNILLVLQTPRMGGKYYCLPCRRKERLATTTKNCNFNKISREIAQYAVSKGFLPKPNSFYCVDCGKQAESYDHRDYSKPLDVVPVCIGCNNKRWKGIPLLEPVVGPTWIPIDSKKPKFTPRKSK